MKQLLTALFLMVFALNALAQESQTTLYFETLNGSRDSLIVGCHPNASQGLDTLLGERAYSRDSVGFVWSHPCGDQWSYIGDFNWDSSIYQKKQLIARDTTSKWSWCHTPIAIAFEWDSLPIRMTWDSIFFSNPEVSRTIFTTRIPGYWGCEFAKLYNAYTVDDYFWGSDRIITKTNELILQHTDGVGVWSNVTDSATARYLNCIFMAFKSESDLGLMDVNTNEQDDGINIYSCHNTLTVKSEDTSKEIQTIRIYSINGTLMLDKAVNATEATFNTSSWSKGVYVLTTVTKDHVVNQRVVIK
ncbi:MAG: T9SS type A sorting domain-containing protein [Bacteroidales bacterium]|nr:T9SS type A sorting domain-containing protein [Bacteroidales bacterium]